MAEAQNQSIGTNRQAVSPRKLMFLSEGIYVLKHFLSDSFLFGVPAIRLYQLQFACSCLMFAPINSTFQWYFGKWTAKQKLFHVVLSRTVSHEHDELCIAL